MSENKIHIDFETYCDLDIKKVGMYKYVEHKSFEVLCFAYSINSGSVKLWTPEQHVKSQHADLLTALEDDSYYIYGFNVMFEKLVIDKFFKIEPKLSRYRDTQAISRYFGYAGSLDMVSEAMFQQKDKKG